MKKLVSYSVYDICETAMLVAAAILFDLPFLKIRIGGNGGSISLTMLPLFILAIRQGPIKGFIAIGIVYGLITCLIDGWGFETYPLDYLLAYGSSAIVGLAPIISKKELSKSYYVLAGIFGILAVICRLFFSTLDSVVLWDYTFGAGLIYNIPYVLPSGGIAVVGLLILLKPLSKISKRNSLSC